MCRWLDFLTLGWLPMGPPSDNLGGILATADWLSKEHCERQKVIRDVLTALIKAHEIQGIALENAFNQVGLDHVILVKVASTAVVSHLLGLERTTNSQ